MPVAGVAAGSVQVEEQIAFGEDRRFRGIDVFGVARRVVFGREVGLASGEGDDPTLVPICPAQPVPFTITNATVNIDLANGSTQPVVAGGTCQIQEPELVMDILKYGREVEVLAPASLRIRVAGELAAGAALYKDGPGDA